MQPKSFFQALYHQLTAQLNRIPEIPRNFAVTVVLLFIAYCSSSVLITHTGGENNSALVFVLAVTIISFLTTSYVYGIIASIVGTFFINFYFMVPYAQFSLSQSGYPVAMLSMLAISCLVCALRPCAGKKAQRPCMSRTRS